MFQRLSALLTLQHNTEILMCLKNLIASYIIDVMRHFVDVLGIKRGKH